MTLLAPPVPVLFEATWFDGVSAVAHPVLVGLSGRTLTVRDAHGRLLAREALAVVRMSDPYRHAPRLLALPGGATVEIADGAAFSRAAGRYGRPRGIAARIERQPWFGVGGLLVVLAVAILAYTHGIPFLAKVIAHALPQSIERKAGDELLRTLEGRQFGPTKLDEDRRRAIEARFAEAARRVAPDVAWRLEFRQAPGPGSVNAFALPGGTIVLLDGLVEKADDDQLLAVLGHELGHVAGRHVMRNIVQAVGVGLFAGLVWGDFAGVAANVPAALAVLDYSRDFEIEADDFAARFLEASGLTVEPYLRFLDVIASLEGRRMGFEMPEFTSTHPDTRWRAERLRKRLESTGGARRP